MKERFPPSPEEPGVNGNLLLPELTVGKFFVGIKKLGEKKKGTISKQQFYFLPQQ